MLRLMSTKGRKQVNRICRKRNAWVRHMIMGLAPEKRRDPRQWAMLQDVAFFTIRS